MRKLLDTTEHLYSPAKAEAIAAALQADDEDGWTYTAVHDSDSTGYSYVAVYDEDGELIGQM